jgi:hypothetical protein
MEASEAGVAVYFSSQHQRCVCYMCAGSALECAHISRHARAGAGKAHGWAVLSTVPLILSLLDLAEHVYDTGRSKSDSPSAAVGHTSAVALQISACMHVMLHSLGAQIILCT